MLHVTHDIKRSKKINLKVLYLVFNLLRNAHGPPLTKSRRQLAFESNCYNIFMTWFVFTWLTQTLGYGDSKPRILIGNLMGRNDTRPVPSRTIAVVNLNWWYLYCGLRRWVSRCWSCCVILAIMMILRAGEQQTIRVSPNHNAHSEEFIAWKFENVKFGSIGEIETGGKLF